MKRLIGLLILIACLAALWRPEKGPDLGYRIVAPQGPAVHGPCAFRPDGSILACGDNCGVSLWQMPQRRYVGSLRMSQSSITSIAWSPDGKLLAAGSYQGQVSLAEPSSGSVWHLESSELLPSGSDSQETAVIFHPKSSLLLTGSPFGQGKCWDASTRSLQGLLPESAPTLQMRFSQDGNYLVLLSDKKLTSWSWPGQKKLGERPVACHWKNRLDPAAGLVISTGNEVGVTAGGRFYRFTLPNLEPIGVAADCANKGLANDGKVWLASTLGAPSHLNAGHLALSPDGRLLICSDGTDAVTVVDQLSGTRLGLEAPYQPVLDASVRNNMLALVTYGPIQLWPLEQANPGLQLPFPDWGPALRWSPSGRRLAAAADEKFAIFDTQNGKCLKQTPLSPSVSGMYRADRLAWSQDENTVTMALKKSYASSFSTKPLLRQVQLQPWRDRTIPLPEGPIPWPADLHHPSGAEAATIFECEADGSVSLRDAHSKMFLGSLLFYPGGWLFLQPDGCYDGSPGIERKVTLRRQNRVHSLHQFPTRLKKPGLFHRVALGERPNALFTAEPPAELEL